MKALVLILACMLCVRGDLVEIYAQDDSDTYSQMLSSQEDFSQVENTEYNFLQEKQENGLWEESQPETLYVMDQGMDGSYELTGMIQNFEMDNIDQPVSQLLERPPLSFFDLSWSSWVDERLQILDLVQDLLVMPSSNCPHMQPQSSSFDTGMVSYLASSRFGPAILTTYAQKLRDSDELEFNYDDVHITEAALSKSYEDASLLEDFSANANEAFQNAENSLQSQVQPGSLGFFAANLKTSQNRAMYQLDGEFESVQPSLRTPASYFASWESFDNGAGGDLTRDSQQVAVQGNGQLTNCVVFVMLLVGCMYVWISLARSCCTTFLEARQRKRDQKEAGHSPTQKDLLAPLDPEKAYDASIVEVAANETPAGDYYLAHGTGFKKVLIPLV